MMKVNPATRFSFAAALLISLTFVFVKIRQVCTVEPFIRESYAISWDIYGYYLHLPATFIHNDPGIEDRAWLDSLNTKYQAGRPFYQAHPGQNNRMVNVYPAGLAICNLPFFTLGHISAKLFGYPPDGLSPPYQWAIIFSGLFYGVLGCWLLRKLLLRFFPDKLTAAVLLSICFGTNLYYYATYDSSMPHVHLFALDTLLLLATISWHERPRKRMALAIGLLLGLITITRPSEIVWMLVPLFWNVTGWKTLKEKVALLWKHVSHVALLVTGMALLGSVQLLYWKYTSGNWFSNNHTEGFDFFRPFTIEVLFSYKKGWLLYTPMMTLAIAGLFLLYRENRKLFVPFLFFFIANLWFISSWECWWYAGTFGQRSFVQSYGLMAIPLGYLLQRMSMKKFLRITAFVLVLFFILLNQFQTFQLRRGLIHGELMTKEAYWAVFGQTRMRPEWQSLMEVDRGNLSALDEVRELYTTRKVMSGDFEQPVEPAPGPVVIRCDTFGFNSKGSQRLNHINDFSVTWERPFHEITSKDHIRMRFSADVYATPEFAGKSFNMVSKVIGNRWQVYGYSPIPFDTAQVKPGAWTHISGDFITPYILHPDDIVQVNIWNNGGAVIFVDNLELVIYEPK